MPTQPTAPHPSNIRKTTLYNGCTIAYTDEGAGEETLLFIHGLGTYSGTWQKNITALKKKHRCIAIDLPGNGYSTAGDYPYTMDFFARSIIDFIGRTGLQRVTLVGHSMGGQIALTAALMLPACCERLILCAPAGFEVFSGHEQLMYKASLSYMSWLTSNEQAIQHLVRTSFYRQPADAARLQKTLIAMAQRQPARQYKTMTDRSVAAMLNEPVAEMLVRIMQPILVIFGEQDALIPNTLLHPGSTRQVAEAGVKRLRRGSLRIIGKGGHFVQWECAVEVNRLIADWMSTAQAPL